MLEMVQTKSAASSVTDHRGNIAVAGGGESASVISQHNNHRWRLFQVSIGERMERRGGVEERGGEVAGGDATQQCAIAEPFPRVSSHREQQMILFLSRWFPVSISTINMAYALNQHPVKMR